MKKISLSQNVINIVVLVMFSFIIFILFYGNINVRKYIEKEQEAENNKSEYENMALEMEDLTNYLTDMARKFSVTEDYECVELYWNEVYVKHSVKNVMEKLDKFELTEHEKHLLNLAKDYTDLHMETEVRSMRLLSDVLPEAKAVMPQKVLNYKLNCVDLYLSDEEKKVVAQQVLYSAQYEADKQTIKDAINAFQSTINERLKNELDGARQNTKTALEYQKILLIISLMMVCLIVALYYLYLIKPILNYTNKLKIDTKGEVQKLQPQGLKEVRMLAESYNEMYEDVIVSSQAKSAFLATMSHEIRTPLNTIIGYINLMDSFEMEKKMRSQFETIKKASQNLLSMINNILDLQKFEKNKIEFEVREFAIERFMEEIWLVYNEIAKKQGLKFFIDLEGYIPKFIYTDETRLRQVMNNIISNALKFTQEGEICVSVIGEKEDEDFVQLTFKVADTGIGIAKNKLDSIFNYYEQAGADITREYGGSGLGLSICKEIVEKQNGKIWVKSKKGKGSVFYVKLRFKVAKDDESFEIMENNNERKFNNVKILIVDDNSTNLNMQCELFERVGFVVDSALSGQIAIAKANKIKYDVILMDIRMPYMDGYSATAMIRNIKGYEKTPIIAMTADNTRETEKKAYESGMNGFLSKPIDIKRLLNEFQKYFKSYVIEDNEVNEKIKLDLSKEEIISNYNELEFLCKECDLRAIKCWEDKEEIFKSIFNNKTFKRLDELINGYQLDVAYEVIAEVKVDA